MSESVDATATSAAKTVNNASHNSQKTRKSPEATAYNNNNNSNNKTVPSSITRERSFVRTSSHQQNANKRRSLAFNVQTSSGGVQMRGNPAMEIYRPPKVNFNITHSTSSSTVFPVPQSKSAAALHQHMQYVAASNAAMLNRRQAALSVGNVPVVNLNAAGKQHFITRRPVLVTNSYPMPFGSVGGVVQDLSHQQQQQQIPVPSSAQPGANLHQPAQNTNRVKFAAEPRKSHKSHQQQQQHQHQSNKTHYHHHNNQNSHASPANHYTINNNSSNQNYINSVDPYNNTLQRSKSLSSADALTRGIAGLGLGLGDEATDVGQFSPEVQMLLSTALEDPNKLNSRCLMELTLHLLQRAVEGRRYALPISRLCLNIIAKEQKETFLEALLNTCRQWYQNREKLLFTMLGMKSPSRVRFTAFMAFLTEMFCQLKRRQIQMHNQSEGAPPSLVLLTLLAKCCEDCVKPPVRSVSEIECLFYVLTCIGLDLETQLPLQLETLLALIRDAFLNANDSAPAIRKTLLQLIELQACHWQLPGNTVLYYYPSK